MIPAFLNILLVSFSFQDPARWHCLLFSKHAPPYSPFVPLFLVLSSLLQESGALSTKAPFCFCLYHLRLVAQGLDPNSQSTNTQLCWFSDETNRNSGRHENVGRASYKARTVCTHVGRCWRKSREGRQPMRWTQAWGTANHKCPPAVKEEVPGLQGHLPTCDPAVWIRCLRMAKVIGAALTPDCLLSCYKLFQTAWGSPPTSHFM